MARRLIHRLKRLESCFRPDYKRPEIVIECVGPNREVLRTFVLTAAGLQERPNPRVPANGIER
jgi:Flp pilus assembly CpaE family ATPase